MHATDPLEVAKFNLGEGTIKFNRCSSSTVESSCQQFSQACSEVANRATVFTDLHFPYSVEIMRSLRDVFLLYTDEKVFKKNFKKKIQDFNKLVQKQATSVAVLPKVFRMLLANFEDLQRGVSTVIDSIQAEAAQKRVASHYARKNAQSEKARFDEEAKKFDAKARQLLKEEVKCDDQKERYEEQAKTYEIKASWLIYKALGWDEEATRQSERAKRLEERATEKGEECARGRKKAIEEKERAKANGENALRDGNRAAEQAMQEARKCDTAALLFQNDMTHCLSRYIEAIQKVREFFSCLASELERCHGEVTAARTTERSRRATVIVSIRRYVDGIRKSCDMFETFRTEVQANLPIPSTKINTKACITGWCAKCEASGWLQPHETRDILHRLGLQRQDLAWQQSSFNPLQMFLKLNIKAGHNFIKHRS